MKDNSPLIPPRLHRGDCLGLFSPAGPVRDQDRIDAGIRLLHELGFRTRRLNLPEELHGYLAAGDRTRIEEFHALWADEAIHGLMAVRGGYGCLRILHAVDLDLVRHRPKILIGFSDITALLNLVSGRAGLVAVHGPVATSLADCGLDSVRALLALLSGEHPDYNPGRRIEILRPGTATGNLRGGNLATLVHLLGTPWEPCWADAVLVLEDTGEPMYKIDRMLTQLYHAGKLDHLAGMLLGAFDVGDNAADNLRLQEQIWDRVLELTGRFGYPVWGGFPVGHHGPNYPLLLGASATMDSSAGELVVHDLLY